MLFKRHLPIRNGGRPVGKYLARIGDLKLPAAPVVIRASMPAVHTHGARQREDASASHWPRTEVHRTQRRVGPRVAKRGLTVAYNRGAGAAASTRSPTHATTHQILDHPPNQPTTRTASAESRPLSDAEDVRTGEGRQSGPCALICAVAGCWHVALRDAVHTNLYTRGAWSYRYTPVS